MTTPPTPMQDPLLQNVPAIEGYKVLGKTVLLAHLGTGGMGVVYRGWHMAFRIDVAVKVLKASLRITHQHVVRAYDVEERHGLDAEPEPTTVSILRDGALSDSGIPDPRRRDRPLHRGGSRGRPRGRLRYFARLSVEETVP